jgi:DNA uptake protein ComE-like DNA-binding protein
VRSGIFYFLLLLCLLQAVKCILNTGYFEMPASKPITSLPVATARLDTLRATLANQNSWTLRPLDPNDLDDYKGYLLGIPFHVLDSLYAFMSKGGQISAMGEFKIISGLPDSTCQRLAPFFKFPKYPTPKEFPKNPKVRDLNTATAEELQVVRGIGPVLSKRIVRFRKALGGFLIASQIEDVYGLDPETARRALKVFPLRTVPSLEKIDLNAASVEELSGILYLNPQMARDIVAFRNVIGAYENLEQLNSVESLPSDKIDRIALYLML